MSGPCCTVMNAVSYSIVTDRACTVYPLQKWCMGSNECMWQAIQMEAAAEVDVVGKNKTVFSQLLMKHL